LAQAFEDELAREASGNHPLAGVPVSAIGQHAGNDDVLFALKDGTDRFAEVHLTWAGQAESPPWPMTAMFASEADWIERGMRVDHEG
jgi:hypothetical protein